MNLAESLAARHQIRSAEQSLAATLMRAVEVAAGRQDEPGGPAAVGPRPARMAGLAMAYIDAQDDLPATVLGEMYRLLREYEAETERFLLWSVQRWAVRERTARYERLRARQQQRRAAIRSGVVMGRRLRAVLASDRARTVAAQVALLIVLVILPGLVGGAR